MAPVSGPGLNTEAPFEVAGYRVDPSALRVIGAGKEVRLEAKAMQAIRARKIDEELRLWLRRIRDEAYVEYIDANLNPEKLQP